MDVGGDISLVVVVLLAAWYFIDGFSFSLSFQQSVEAFFQTLFLSPPPGLVLVLSLLDPPESKIPRTIYLSSPGFFETPSRLN